MGNAASEYCIGSIVVHEPTKTLEAVLTELADKKAWDTVAQIFADNPSISFTPEKSSQRLPLHLAIIGHAPQIVIQTLVSSNNLAVNVLDAAGESPVHYAITTKASLALITILTQANHTCMEVCDSQGLLPLHKALQYRSPTAIVMHILNTYPDGAFERTKDGKLALHYACEHHASLEVLQLLLELNNDATSEAHNGRLPIHYACEHKAPLDVITTLHAANETCIATKGLDGMYPLHVAVKYKSSVAVVEYLIQTYSDALMHRDRKGLHPIHYALERNAPDALVKCILTHRPETASLRGKGSPGNFPLSTALDKHYSSEIVRMILHAHPPAAGEANMLRFLPLQSAIKHNISDIALLTELLLAYPTAASVVDHHHRIVLHYCASRNMELAFIQRVLEAHPQGACAKDKNDQIPLHLAVTRLCDLPLIQLLLTYHKNGVLDSDRYGMVPLNYAIENDAPIEMIHALIQANSKCTHHRISQHRTVLHHAVEFRRSTETVRAIVEAYPEATQIQESAQGRLPLHWAIERLLPLSTLLCIDDANPVQGAFVKDHKGWRSIHYAIHFPTPTPLVTRILQANPAIATTGDDPLHIHYYTNHYEGYYTALYKDYVTPVVADTDVFLLLHYAIAHDALPDTVAEILLYTMPFSPGGEFNPHHYDTWMYVTAYSGDKYWRSIDIVLSEYEHNQVIITQLAEFCDQTTVRCMDIATPRCLHEILRRMYYYSRYEMHNKLSIHKSRYSLVHSAIYHNTVFGAAIVNHPTNSDSLHNGAGNNTTSISNSRDKSTNDTVTTPVVLKFTNQRSKFIRETTVRTKGVISSTGSVRTNNTTLNPAYIIEMLAWHNAQEDLKYGSETVLKGFEKYPFLLVFKQGDRDLGSICKHEHLTATVAITDGGDEEEDSSLDLIRSYMVMILKCVQYLHEEVGVVHGDLKPSNIIRESNALKLTNLGAACKYTNKELVTAELQQLAYAAPELALLQRHTDNANRISTSRGGVQTAHDPHFVNAAAQLHSVPSSAVDPSLSHTHPSDLAPVPNLAHARILAHPSQDMWSVGAIFYLLLTGESLFLNSVSEDIDSDQVDMLIEWPEFVKQRRLDKVNNVYARALLSQLLSKDPQLRPSARYCLESVFCTNRTSAVRYVGIRAEYDVYLCYRRQSYDECTAVDAPLLLNTDQERADEVEEAVVPYTDHDPNTVEEADQYRAKAVSQRKDSALNRMFGNISLSDSEINEEDSLMSENPENNSLDADSAEISAFGDQTNTKEDVLDTPKIIDSSTNDGKYSLLQQYCRSVGLSAAPTATCALSHQPHKAASQDITTNNDTENALARDILITKSSAAVIMLTRETWKCLEDLNTRLVKEDKKNNPRGSMKATTVSTNATTTSEETAEQDALLEDFLYELRVIIELQSMGLLEREVYVYAIGSPTLNTTEGTNNTTANNTDHNATTNDIATVAEYTLDSYFQHYLGEMVGRYGNSHPPSSMPNVTIPKVEQRVTEYLTRYGYGVQSRHANMSLYEMFRFLVRFPTFHILGPEKEAYQKATSNLMKLISGGGRINQSNSEGLNMYGSVSRPNTGAFNMLRNSRLGSPQVLPRLTSATSRTTMHNGGLTNPHSGSFSYNNLGSRNIGSIAAGITAGVNTGILSMGGTVPRTLSRGGMHSSSGRLHTPHSLSYSIPHTPNMNSVSMTNLTLPAIHTQHADYANNNNHHSPYTSNQQSDTVYYPPARSPVTGLRVRTYSSSRSPQRVNYTDITNEQVGTVHNMYPNTNDGMRGKTPASAQKRPITSEESDAFAHNIPIRRWSNDEGEHTHGNNNLSFPAFEPLLENEVTFYNNQDIVTVPYFTEVIGEDRARTAHAMSYMTTKLEESENTIANLEDELALLRQQMHNKDAELSKLRTVVKANQSGQPMNIPGAVSVAGSSVVLPAPGGKKW